MKRLSFLSASAAGVLLLLWSTSLQASLCPNYYYISGTMSATQVEQGQYEGLYLYSIDLKWNLNKDLRRWDLILPDGVADDDNLIIVPSHAGTSTLIHSWKKRPVLWTGFFHENGDSSIYPDITAPVITYQTRKIAGRSGSGTFIFYSNIVPEYLGPYDDAILAKAGCRDIYGTITGAFPITFTSNVPEPATVVFLAAGIIALICRNRRR